MQGLVRAGAVARPRPRGGEPRPRRSAGRLVPPIPQTPRVGRADSRADPTTIDGSRRKRIARGSGTTIQAVNQLVKQFAQMRKMMAQLSAGKMPDPQQLLKGMR